MNFYFSHLIKKCFLWMFFCLFALQTTFFLFIPAGNANQYIQKKPIWFYESYDGIKSMKVINSNMIYIHTSNELAAYNTDGALMWTFHPDGDEIVSYKLEGEDIVYIQTKYSLCALNYDGTERWCFRANNDEKLKSFKVALDGDVYVLTSTEFYSLDPVDGEENWHFSQDSETKKFEVLDNGTIYVRTTNSVYAFDAYY